MKAVKKVIKVAMIFAVVFAGIYIAAGCLPPMRPIYFKENPEQLFWVKTAGAFAIAVLTAFLCGGILGKREEV